LFPIGQPATIKHLVGFEMFITISGYFILNGTEDFDHKKYDCLGRKPHKIKKKGKKKTERHPFQ
jgi:hypothetical protein